jgi:NADH-quinone oxidoreductase subunit M
MLLAGVVMKLGAYGALRVAMTLFPAGLEAWRETIAILATIGIVYGATVALVQKDFKFVIGYSSVSHMGFVLLGMMTLRSIGLSGAVLQMFSHGVVAGLLFGVVGRMVYDRTHTRDLGELETMGLQRALPFAAFTFVIGSLASMGMPGFSGFVAELQVLIGTWREYPVLAMLTGAGILIGVAYTLRAMQKAFYGAMPLSTVPEHQTFPNITTPERIGAAILMLITLAVGLYPTWLLKVIRSGFESPLMAPLVKGGV